MSDVLCTFKVNKNTRCPICNKLLVLHMTEENFIRIDDEGYANEPLSGGIDIKLICPSCKKDFEYITFGRKYFIKSDDLRNNIKLTIENPFVKYD